MAFYSHSPRFPPVYLPTIQQQGRVGPGSYYKYKPEKQLPSCGSQHVFNSKIPRDLILNNSSASQLGPGQYDFQQSYPKFIVKKISNGCKSSFDSKIQRFQDSPTKHKKDEPQQKTINIYQFLTDQKSHEKKAGTLYGIKRDRQLVSKSIPSIPSADQSYGYRIDLKTKKLVQNENPNILLARKTFLNSVDSNAFKSKNDCYNGPGSYFIKNGLKKHIGGVKWQKQESKKQKQNILDQNCDSINYEPQYQQIDILQHDKKKWLEKGNIVTSKEHRLKYQAFDNKKQLMLNAIKKKFGDYIKDNQINLMQVVTNSEKLNKIKMV